MAKHAAGDRTKRVFFTKSLIKYLSIEAEGEEIDGSRQADFVAGAPPPSGRGKLPWWELGESWIAEALRDAAGEDDPHLFKLLLRYLLATIGIYPPPPGVFTPFPKTGTPGRRVSSFNEKLYETWESMGRPSMTKLASRVYAHYTKADFVEGRKLRERCDKAIIRAMERRARDNERRLAELSAKAGLGKG